MIAELLGEGAENALSGRELAALLNCDMRTITALVERERRTGKPICANSAGDNTGYYLAESPDELESYCDRLYHRENELRKTRRALLSTLSQMA